MRGTGGNRFYPHPMTETEFLLAICMGLDELRRWAAPDRALDLSSVTIDTKLVGDHVSVSVTADLADKGVA